MTTACQRVHMFWRHQGYLICWPANLLNKCICGSMQASVFSLSLTLQYRPFFWQVCFSSFSKDNVWCLIKKKKKHVQGIFWWLVLMTEYSLMQILDWVSLHMVKHIWLVWNLERYRAIKFDIAIGLIESEGTCVLTLFLPKHALLKHSILSQYRQD